MHRRYQFLGTTFLQKKSILKDYFLAKKINKIPKRNSSENIIIYGFQFF